MSKFIINRTTAACALILIHLGCAQRQPDVASQVLLPRFHKVDDNLYRGGQPQNSGFETLKTMGIRTVVNLRRDNDEKATVEGFRMRYVHIPLTAEKGIPNSAVIDFFRIVNDPANRPVFVHCKRGIDRTGAMMAFYRISFQKWTPERAEKEAISLGMGWWQFRLKEQILNFSPLDLGGKSTGAGSGEKLPSSRL